MRILQLRLINVKSYVDETLDFQPGINFISGINGAGKSTIIESIGYGLFNHNPYVLKQLLREGASQGEIQVLIEGTDERLYRVIRKFSAASNLKWEVWDEETSAMLDELHGMDDVSLWLKRTMGIAPSDNLADLFRQVIAVQQGQFAAPFLETAGPRTKTFDAVLKVEDFRQAFQNTAFLERDLAHEVETLQREQEILAFTLVDLPEVEAQVEDVQNQFETKQKAIQELEVDLSANLAVLEIQQKHQETLEQLHKDLLLLGVQLEGLEEQLKEVGKDYAEAKQARLVVEVHRSGFERYEQIQAGLQVVEARLEQKRSLQEQITQRELVLATTSAKLETDQMRWTEKKLHVDQALVTTGEQLQAQELIVQHLLKVEGDVGSWAPLITRWQPLLKEREGWVKSHRHILDQARTQRQRLADLQLSLSEVATALEELPRLQQELIQLEEGDKLETLRQQQVEKQGELDALLRNEDYLAKGLCPIIQEVCPSERVAHGLDEFFQEQKDKLGFELAQLSSEVAGALQVQAERNALRDRVRDAQNQETHLREQQGDFVQILQAVFGALVNLPWYELHKISDQIGDLGEYYEEQRALLVAKLPHWGLEAHVDLPSPPSLADPVPPLPEDQDLEQLGSWLKAWASWETQLSSIYDAWQSYGQAWLVQLNHVKAQLATKLAVAQGAKERLKAELDQLRKQEAQLAQELVDFGKKQGEIAELNTEVASLKSQVTSLDQPEEELKKQKEELGHYQASYHLYQTNLQVSERLPALESRLATLNASYGNLQENRARKTAEQALLLDQYSPDIHRALEGQVQEQKTGHLELKRDLQELSRRQGDLSVRLAKLKETEGMWREKEAQLKHTRASQEFTRLFRQVLKEAADPIAQQYRNSLSLAATNIYRQVANENVSVEWGSQYELQLVDYDQGKERVRVFRQLSGGEQMTAALAIRLALMQLLSPINIGFFDEPTTNLDRERRQSLALAIQNATADFDQLFLISHDDSFDTVTENVISLRKDQGEGTQVEFV